MPQNRLAVRPLRRLSPLERYAVDLVFNGRIDLAELRVEVPDQVRGHAGTYGGNGKIKISRLKHQYADDLHIFTEVDDIDKLNPDNISYLSTLVHEVGHHWQSVHKRHNTRRPYYEFSDNVLRTANFICSEQHASVGQVYFILKWQWDLGIPRLDLTDGATRAGLGVGPTNRYCRIAVRDLDSNQKRYMSRREVSKFFPRRFDPYLVDLN